MTLTITIPDEFAPVFEEMHRHYCDYASAKGDPLVSREEFALAGVLKNVIEGKKAWDLSGHEDITKARAVKASPWRPKGK